MKEINRTENTTFLFSTHDDSVIRQARRIIKLRDGKIESLGESVASVATTSPAH